VWRQPRSSYVLCVRNRGYRASLELRKVYRKSADAWARGRNLVRIVDESGDATSILDITSSRLPSQEQRARRSRGNHGTHWPLRAGEGAGYFQDIQAYASFGLAKRYVGQTSLTVANENARLFTAIIQREDDADVALCPELDIASQGGSIEDALSNLREAIALFFQAADPREILGRQRGPVFVIHFQAARG
jgi:predicted RNase H-like HicB family nuclease